MTQYGLEENEIAAIKNILAQHDEVEQAILYGSRAKGNFKPASDIDLVLKGQKLTVAIQSRIADELDDLLLPYKFDLSVFHQISNEDLLEHIRRVGVIIYEDKPDEHEDKIWNEWAFSDFVDINPSVRLKSSEEYSFVEMKDLTDGQRNVYPSAKRMLSGGARFQDGDTLFARITPCLENGKICQVQGLENGAGFGSTEFLVFRGKEGISDSNFIFYLSRSSVVRKYAEQHLIGTSGRQRVNKEAFGNLRLRLPKIDIQYKIAAILTSLDDKIELNRQTNQTLEEIAKTLFQEMCVPKGDELPEGWSVVKLGDVFKTSSGGTPSRGKAEFYENGAINWVKSKELGEVFVLDTEEKISEAGLQKSSAKLLPKNSILLAMYGATVGEVSILGEPASCNQAICAILTWFRFGLHFLLVSN